jgi:hypothetical protein
VGILRAARKRNNLFCARGIIYDPLAAGESSEQKKQKNHCAVFNGFEFQAEVTTGCAGCSLVALVSVYLSFRPKEESARGRHRGAAGDSRFLNGYAVSE